MQTARLKGWWPNNPPAIGTRLVGYVFDHPLQEDGRLVKTSPVVEVRPDGKVQTHNTLYTLQEWDDSKYAIRQDRYGHCHVVDTTTGEPEYNSEVLRVNKRHNESFESCKTRAQYLVDMLEARSCETS